MVQQNKYRDADKNLYNLMLPTFHCFVTTISNVLMNATKLSNAIPYNPLNFGQPFTLMVYASSISGLFFDSSLNVTLTSPSYSCSINSRGAWNIKAITSLDNPYEDLLGFDTSLPFAIVALSILSLSNA